MGWMDQIWQKMLLQLIRKLDDFMFDGFWGQSLLEKLLLYLKKKRKKEETSPAALVIKSY